MGVQIRGPKDSWLRFAVLEVPWESVPEWVVKDYEAWKRQDRTQHLLETALPLHWD